MLPPAIASLVTDNAKEANSLALELEKKNIERLQQTNILMDKANLAVVTAGVEQPLLLAAGEDYSPGVMGLVAGRLSDKYYRPAILIRIGHEFSRGSGRSIDEFNLMAALESCSDLLNNFGGHNRAAGFNVSTGNLSAFQERITNLAREKLDGLDLRPRINIDAEVDLSSFSGEMYQKIQQLAPFGVGNPLPVFLSRRVEIQEQHLCGTQNEHLKLKLKKQSGKVWDAMGFGLGGYTSEMTRCMDMVYTVELNRWNGQETLRLNLIDFEPSK